MEFVIDGHLTIGDRSFDQNISLFSNEAIHYIKEDGYFYKDIVTSLYSYEQYPEHQYIENKDQNIFILASCATASAAGDFVDVSKNMENIVIIGTNTSGVYINMANYEIAMPYSRLRLEFSECLNYSDSNYFRESYGIEPDIYLTGKNLQKRLKSFFENYVEIL